MTLQTRLQRSVQRFDLPGHHFQWTKVVIIGMNFYLKGALFLVRVYELVLLTPSA